MGNLYTHPGWWQNGNSTLPPGPPDMEKRITTIETILPTLVSKEDLLLTKQDLTREIHEVSKEVHEVRESVQGLRTDMHEQLNNQNWRFVRWVSAVFISVSSALVAATYFISRHAT